MDSISKEQISTLLNYQNLEMEVESLNDALGIIPEKIGKLDEKLNDFELEIKTQKDSLEEFKKVYRDYEADVQENLLHMKKSDEKLVSVKTNKEYNAILKEIEQLKRKNSKLEDKMLEKLESIEKNEKTVEEKNAEFLKFKDEINNKKSAIEKESEGKRKELAGFDEKIKNISEKIDPKLMEKYKHIRTQSQGVGITVVNDAVCQGCHMNIPPQMYNELHQNDTLKFCPHCNRILYVKNDEGTMETSG